MSVTFYASGEAEAAESPRLNLSNNQARDFFRWLGLPANDLCGSMLAAELAERIRRVLHPAVVDVGDEGKPPVELTHPSGGSEFFGGRRGGTLAEWARQLLRIAETAGPRDVVWT
jgi:hypothetical protein